MLWRQRWRRCAVVVSGGGGLGHRARPSRGRNRDTHDSGLCLMTTVFLKWQGCLTTTCHRAVSLLAHVCTASGGCAVCAQRCARTPTPSSQGTPTLCSRPRGLFRLNVVFEKFFFFFLFSHNFCKSETFDEGVGEFEARKWGLKKRATCLLTYYRGMLPVRGGELSSLLSNSNPQKVKKSSQQVKKSSHHPLFLKLRLNQKACWGASCA